MHPLTADHAYRRFHSASADLGTFHLLSCVLPLYSRSGGRGKPSIRGALDGYLTTSTISHFDEAPATTTVTDEGSSQ
jgi:hypothetical protein